MKRKILTYLPAAAAVLALFAAGCALRPAGTAAAPALPAPSAEAAAPTPEAPRTVRVEYRAGDEVLLLTEIEAGELPPEAPVPEGARIIGWTWESGEATVPGTVPLWSDTAFYAVTCPLLRGDAALFFPDEHGLFRPADVLTRAEAAAALRALLQRPEDLAETLAAWDAAPEEVLPCSEFKDLLAVLFAPDEAEAAAAELLPEGALTVTRAEAAACLARLTGRGAAEDAPYFPDVSPSRPDSAAILALAAEGTAAPEEWLVKAKDGFVWIDGYLYRIDDEGYFLQDVTEDSLYYDANGRYTCGNEELDGFVAEALVKLTLPENTRRQDLKAVYNHVKNDFSYLPRNYYASGATGWEIEEALTIFRTGKGNCYCYAGAFCALARGLGYNAVTYSGTMGNQDQPHAWTEISLDGGIYICDPEIEWNYWYLQMYTDNFMMPRESAGGWNYQAVGRT